MLTGFNTDFRYKGTVYHVQTEDNGVQNPVIVTLLYQGGAILASRKTSYADIIKFERLDEVVKGLMEEQHKQVIKDLVAGDFSPKPVAGGGQGPKNKVEDDLPEITDKGLDSIILDYLSSEEDGKK